VSASKYRQRHVVVQAMQLDGANMAEILDWVDSWWPDDFGPAYITRKGQLCLETEQGDVPVSEGDFIVRNVQGQFHALKPDIFVQIYEPVMS
jgi:hypothetical protein